MSVTRAEALQALMGICDRFAPDRRWRAIADGRDRWLGGFEEPKLGLWANVKPPCSNQGGMALTVTRVGDRECCHRFAWNEIFATCDGRPRQEPLL